MTGWARALEALRGPYVADGLARLARADGNLDALARAPGDAAALAALRREVHGLAGTGASYGFPEVTRVAHEADVACATWQREGTLPDATGLRSVREAVASLRALLVAARDDAG